MVKPRKKSTVTTGNADHCKKDGSKKKYCRKRRFGGNQYSNKTDKTSTEEAGTTKSRRQSVVTEEDKENTATNKKVKNVFLKQSNSIEGFRLIDMPILQDLLGSLFCPECLEPSLNINEDMAKRKGLSSFLTVTCSTCPFSWSSHTSKGAKNDQRVMEVNLRSVYAMRRCGAGHNEWP